jgi:hypothetical protein
MAQTKWKRGWGAGCLWPQANGYGPHAFNIDNEVMRRSDGMRGRVISREALYATIKWADKSITEIEQYTPEVRCLTRW